jgi:hypothetical protein
MSGGHPKGRGVPPERVARRTGVLGRSYGSEPMIMTVPNDVRRPPGAQQVRAKREAAEAASLASVF